MRSITLERDDSIIPFSSLIAMLFHCMLFLLIVIPRPVQTPMMEHIYPSTVSYQVFPGTEKFLTFSPDQKIFSNVKIGITTPTSGNVTVDPRRLASEPSRELAYRGTDRPAEQHSIAARVFYGNTSAGEAASTPQASGQSAPSRALWRGGLQTPDDPNGMLEMPDRNPDRAVGFERSSEPGGTPGVLRSGVASSTAPSRGGSPTGGFTRGVIDIPGARMGLNPSTPQSGTSRDNRAFSPPISMGPHVTDDPNASPRPAGSPVAPTPTPSRYGARRVLYQPAPPYPAWAERDNVQTFNQFDITVGADGRVSRVLLAKSSGYTDIDRSAEESIRRWIYEPRPGQAEVRRVGIKYILKGRGFITQTL